MTLHDLRFDNAWAKFPDDFFTRVTPTPWSGTRVLDVSPLGASQLGLDAEALWRDEDEHATLTSLMAGRKLLPGMEPIAQKYTGHQFGSYNPALGDGRGLLLGEAVTDSGFVDLHLKGAGQTPYSRFGDGRAVLRSSIREYLAGEAMAGLGIPTTTALAVAVNEEKVMRERVEPGATLLRLSESHVRFGHFEWLYQRQRPEDIERLAWHVIERHRPLLREAEAPFEALFEDTVTRTADLIAAWQAYGFVHAVMNTDNMSLLGLTIDYGPYAFMDRYQPRLVPNHTDAEGRYAFNQQPGVALWNLAVLAQSLTPLIDVERLRAILDTFEPRLQSTYADYMRQRLGLAEKWEEDHALVSSWLALLEKHSADFHGAFLSLVDYDGSQASFADVAAALECEPDDDALVQWLRHYTDRLAQEPRSRQQRHDAMASVNPRYVLRTHLAQSVIESAEAGDSEPLRTFRELLADPFTERPDMDVWQQVPSRNAPPVNLSCSS
ncbi:protein adenylyltransferase SelO [Aidingimonas lacisalsi]|uniref:protein adenylyltransferase SelO n=1 Tax=Aidingimonas lacisalsi TaxID=2604086 RepID=UPI00137569CC|nr:YdiU family protein [Aidingimonas lacisalsi]